jgi:hypothetical protein
MSDPFQVIDATTLAEEHRGLLRPGENCAGGRLPRYFYRVDSWAQALATKLTAHFSLAELMSVDCREAGLLLHEFPHYVPCAISILARYLEVFRERVEAPVFVAVNGGYRSPAHGFERTPTLHGWGTAADIFRIGECWLDDEKNIERFGRVAEGIGQEVTAAPYGPGDGQTDDHLHIELGEIHWVPRHGILNSSGAASSE